MKSQFKFAALALGLMSCVTAAVADPAPPVDRTTVTKLPGSALPGIPRTAVGTEPTTPCTANLRIDQIAISRRDGAYDVQVTVINTGTEAAVGGRSDAGAGLGIGLEVISDNQLSPTYQANVHDIDRFPAGSTISYGLSIPRSAVTSTSRIIKVSIKRGADGPRCSYDTNRFDDFLSVTIARMNERFAAGDATFTVRSTVRR